MSTQEIADKLVSMCRVGQGTQALDELYAPNAASIEIPGWPTERVNGIDQLKAKHEQFFSNIEEMHSMEVSDPIVAENFFACTMTYDMTFKTGGRMKSSEICLFETKDGKIVREQFFYPAPPQQ